MKRNAISTPAFDLEQIAAALSAASDTPIADVDNPATQPQNWVNAIVTSGGGVDATLTELRQKQRKQRGAQKHPLKVPTTIRFDADVLAGMKATGPGWQTRINEAIRDWLKNHS